MDHLKVIGIKFIVTAVIVYSLFGIVFNASLMNLFWISVLVTGISYLVGDLFVLRRFGNITAVIADFGLAFLTIWILASILFTGGMPVPLLSLAAAFFIACCEPLIHHYIESQSTDEEKRNIRTKDQLQTEFAEESDAQSITREKKHEDR